MTKCKYLHSSFTLTAFIEFMYLCEFMFFISLQTIIYISTKSIYIHEYLHKVLILHTQHFLTSAKHFNSLIYHDLNVIKQPSSPVHVNIVVIVVVIIIVIVVVVIVVVIVDVVVDIQHHIEHHQEEV